VDANLWGRSIEAGVLEDPWTAPPSDVYEWTAEPADAPPTPGEVTIAFESGLPVTVDGVSLGPVELVDRLNKLAGTHGVGRIDHVEDRLVGIKSREIYEAPAAVTLHAAHRALEGLTMSREQLRFNRLVADEFARATYDGQWFSALQRDLRGYVASAQRIVNGEARVRLGRGAASVVGRRSASSLYDRALATYDAEDRFDHASAVGFIRIFGLPLETEAARQGGAWRWTEPLLANLPTRVSDARSPVGSGQRA
jgi:argininosuccinate synthase